jgi:polar amino acid transport system permease protein
MPFIFHKSSYFSKNAHFIFIFLNMIFAFILISGIFIFAFSRLAYQWNWDAVYIYRYKFIYGWAATVAISLAALAISLFFGVLFAICRRSSCLLLKSLILLYVEVIRGTPLLVQILIFFYVVADAFNIQNRYVAGTVILAFFSAAYICEIVRGGIESIGQSQIDSAKAIGLTRMQAYRYVVFPQAARRILPSLAGQFVSLIKDSSLLSIISISEFTLNAQEVNAFTFSTLESYLPLAVGYLLLTLPISIWTRSLEKRFHYET